MAAHSSTAASADLNIYSEYDVFINHRGPDVKKTFASHLYRALRTYGLKVFLDQAELQQGDYLTPQIEGAIRTASVHVAIFSKGYAESPWCLNELLSMLESGASIVPVFYQVKPSDLRWTQGEDGVYARALRELKEKTTCDPQTQENKSRYSSTTIENWRQALSNVAGISGFELEACNSDEGELQDKVVEIVLRKVKKPPLNVAKYPTGLDEKVIDFENKVLLQHKPQVVGIVGFGGAGKTTLAKELFNRRCSQYERNCFLSDIRETVGKGSVISLQKNLLKGFTGSDLAVDNKDEGIEKLKKHFSSSRILLILDDVDQVDQLDSLVPSQSSIHSESFILITSRNKGVLTNWGVGKSSIYKLNGLNKQYSLELFCRHAFDQPFPLPEFHSLADKFIESCYGLPLSLKVLGALLRGHDLPYCYEQLDRLEKALPGEIQERLLISYEALNEEEKQMFLDIACFFRGETSDMAISIWNGSGWKGWLGFQSLRNKSLVEVSGNNIIEMHDHLRDLGRDIAQRSSPRRLCRWTEDVIDDLLEQSSNAKAITVRGIKMAHREYNDDLFSDIRMRRLRLLDIEEHRDIEDALLDRIWRRVEFPNLIWLRWYWCPYSSLPSWIPMKNLKVLQVSGTSLETLWQEDSQLPGCLEELRAEGCVQLQSVRGLEQATNLRKLDVRRCSELKELPSLETLVSLEELWAYGCVKLQSVRGLEQATKLQVLNVEGCIELEELEGVEHCTWLEMLDVFECPKLQCQVWE